jgi:hypothetical protein
MLPINLVIIFYFTLCLAFLLFVIEIDQFFGYIWRPYNMQRQFCFLNLVCFFPWLAGRFHNFELTQNREKNKKWSLWQLPFLWRHYTMTQKHNVRHTHFTKYVVKQKRKTTKLHVSSKLRICISVGNYCLLIPYLRPSCWFKREVPSNATVD